MPDDFNLQRFVDAQAQIYDAVRGELRAGCKTSHWMWFIFPQIQGLGRSPTARKYAISGRKEAHAYLQHPILGPRLIECTKLVNEVEGKSADDIFGYPDGLKFRSSMTLFAEVSPDNPVFVDALDKYFGGEPDPLTLDRLARHP
jgi:uncharacterized protein (DUF1810 family)